MEIRTVTACYFSPTDTTKKTVEAIAHGIRPVINILDLTLPSAREAQYHFGPEDLLVIGAPVYGGRIPLVEEEAIRHIHGSCTPVVLAAVYGNRAYEDALLELRDLLSCQGFIPAAAGAFIGEHSFAGSGQMRRLRPSNRFLASKLHCWRLLAESTRPLSLPCPRRPIRHCPPNQQRLYFLSALCRSLPHWCHFLQEPGHSGRKPLH